MEKEESTTQPANPAPSTPSLPQFRFDETKLIALYSNFCRVTGNPEELLLDFTLNTQAFGVPEEALIFNQRIVMNYYTAKRTLQALQVTLQRHEAAFGVVETDVQKRLQPSMR